MRADGLVSQEAKGAGERRDRINASANFDDGVVRNIEPTAQVENWGAMLRATGEYLDFGVERVPKTPLRTVQPDVGQIDRRQPGLRVTWLGHSTMLVAIDGALFLTDPVFSKRASPFQWAGPARFHEVPLAIEELPAIDGVVLSHDHFDHLDKAAVIALAKQGLVFYMPLGVGAHLAAWGIPEGQLVELDWWQSREVAGVMLHSAPARHFSGRRIGDRNRTLWTSWAFIGPHHRAWFSGDTGPFAAAAEIGERLGPFDLTMIETGAWHPAWGNIHLGPREAVRMHEQVGGRALLPVHWGTFNLAMHAWDEPIIHVQELCSSTETHLLAPLAGQTLRHDVPAIAPDWEIRWRRWREHSPDAERLTA